jgi:hypothetical protein
MPVKVVLVSDGVKVADATGRVAEKRVGKLVEGADLRLVAQAADLKGKIEGLSK